MRARWAEMYVSATPRARSRHARACAPRRVTSSTSGSAASSPQCLNTPDGKCFQVPIRQMQRGNRKACQRTGFFAFGDYGDSAHCSGLHARGVIVRAHRNRGAKAGIAEAQLRNRSANFSGGPKSRSVPVMSSTKAHAVAWLASSMRGENLAAHSSNTVRAAASPSGDRASSFSPPMVFSLKPGHAQRRAPAPCITGSSRKQFPAARGLPERPLVRHANPAAGAASACAGNSAT